MRGKIFFILTISFVLSACTKQDDGSVKLWYDRPAQNWGEAFPLGNGRLAAMCYGGINTERFQINEESLWAGRPINPVAKNFQENLKKVQEMVLAGDYSKAQDFGLENLTAKPTSFRSYEPFADLIIDFEEDTSISDYKRELDLSSGVCKVSLQRFKDATVTSLSGGILKLDGQILVKGAVEVSLTAGEQKKIGDFSKI